MNLKKLFSFACFCKTKENADEQKAEEYGNNYVKQGVRKHSKMYCALEEVIKYKNMRGSYDPATNETSYRIDLALTCWDEDGTFEPNLLEDDTLEMLEKCGFTPDTARDYLKFVANLKNGNLDDTNTLTDEYINILSSYSISTTDNYLFRLYAVRDENELKQIIEKAPMNANLNWVDVSGLSDIPNIHEVKPGFNGDISLWNV